MPERRRHALAMLSAIDDGVGAIRSSLEKYGILDDTIIFFISDNGAPLKIKKEDLPISFKGGAWDGSLNDPYIGEKGMLSEGGIRIPYIISWPKRLPKGKIYDRPVSSLDVAATSIAVAGLSKSKQLDGVNIIPFLEGKKTGDPHEALYWRFWNQGAIREGNMKYLKAGEREFLFDVSGDLHESKNLINKYPKLVSKMRAKLEKWANGLQKPGLRNEQGRERRWYNYYFKK